MFAGFNEGFHRRPFIGLSVSCKSCTAFLVMEKTMRPTLLLGFGIVTLISLFAATDAWSQRANGKNCRMEQQCHWENFKKVCVYVKVCR
jgi:hypothetical protein